MKKHKIECPYLIFQFKNHLNVKKKLLNLIENSKYESPKILKSEVNISKTDWFLSSDKTRKWVNYFLPFLIEEMKQAYTFLGYDGFTMQELWFQQYYKNSQHGWHTHSSNFTSVYYLELENDAPKTKIVNAFNQKEIIELNVVEGDIVIFPSFVIHQGPKNISNNRKTIISYNTNATYSDKIYGQGLN